MGISFLFIAMILWSKIARIITTTCSVRWQCLTHFAIANHSVGSDSATHLSAANRFPISNSIAFLYWVCRNIVLKSSLKEQIYFGYLWTLMLRFFIQIEGNLVKVQFFPNFRGNTWSMTSELWPRQTFLYQC